MLITTNSSKDLCPENKKKTVQQHDVILFNIVKEVCSDPNTKLSQNMVANINRVIAACDLNHHASFHKVFTSDSTANVFGFINETSRKLALNFDEQAELAQAVIDKINEKIPIVTAELDYLKQITGTELISHIDQIKELQESIEEKLNSLREKEKEKMELMLEWLNNCLHRNSTYIYQPNEILVFMTKVLDLKSKILYLRTVSAIYTETTQSIHAYSEVRKDMQDHLSSIEREIEYYKRIIASDYNTC